MIGPDEMSSTGMDISETFRAGELTKTDFFDFVSAPDMGIGIGVGADAVDIGMGVGSLHAGSVSTATHQHHQQHHQQQQQQQQQQQHRHHQQHSHQQQQHAHHQQQQQHSHEQGNNLAGSMPHDGGGGTGSGSGCVGGRVSTPGNGSSCMDVSDGNSNGNSSDPTLQGYEFWHTDKDPTSRLDATIFEDLDRYCWHQQAVVNAAASPAPTTAATHQQRSTPANSLQHSSHLHSPASPNQALQHQQQQQQQRLHHQSPHQHMHTPQQQQHQPSAAIHHTQRQMSLNNSSSCAQSANQVANNNATNNNTSLSHNHNNSNNNNNNNNPSNSSGNTSMTVDNSDGQIYTITVLNGNEPWLKREPENTAAQLSNTLDLDSLLGSFPGYIKSEYPYDESTAGYGSAEDSGRDGNVTGDMVNGLGMGASPATGLHGGNSGSGVNSQRLPSLVTAISLASGVGGMGSVGSASHTQLAQFQNNNNDWHMADHNAEQNSAESLLRSALQGKGYSKGIQMQNGISLLPSSPTVKEEEMRRLLFPPDADTLSFGDSALGAAQMFEDTHPSQLVGSQHPNGGVNSAGVSSLMVDDMFLSLESAFSDDFEKIKRIANEVQQFCSPTSSADYGAGDVLMQISPAGGGSAGTTSVQQLQQQQQQQQQLLSPATTPTGVPQQQQLSPLPQAAMPALHMTSQQTVGQQQPRVLHTQQQHGASGKSSAITSSSGSTTKVTKKYKRSTSSTQHHNNNNNNNNNPNITNHNSSTGSGNSVTPAGSITANSTNGPASGGSSSSTSSNSPTHCNGQRKERSLHYCSICSKGFKDKYSVNVHIRTHTGEKPFTCSLCGKSFRQKAHLAKHYQTHMAQKHNGGLVKSSGSGSGGGGGGNASKHQRAAAAAASAQSANSVGGGGGMSIVPNSCAGSVVAAAVHQRQLNVATSLGLASGARAVTGGVASTVAVGGPMSGPTLGAVNANVLPPANGLLTNR